MFHKFSAFSNFKHNKKPPTLSFIHRLFNF
nr:MAG TPA: hypothetical protein [Caudoviricetes sp.]